VKQIYRPPASILYVIGITLQSIHSFQLGEIERDSSRLVADLSALRNPQSSALEILLVTPPVEEIRPNRDVLKELQRRS
jgi:hypothetical protein